MVIDTSALIAILTDEPERAVFTQAIDADDVRLLSAASYAEAGIVIGQRFGFEGARDLDDFISEAEIEIVSVDAEQASRVRDAYARFGRGNHAANLNFGDCFAYALAMETFQPLLFKGDDFARTDVARVAR